MNRAFVSLYLIIVLSILVLGLALNKFWDGVNPPIDVDPAVGDLISMIESGLEHNSEDPNQTQLDQLTLGLTYKAKLVSVSNFAKTEIAAKIKQGSVVSVSDDRTHYFYKRLTNSNDVIMLWVPDEADSRGKLYIVFLLLFYSALAGAVFLWVWPLTRDLTRLAQHAQQLGKESEQPIFTISARSVLYPFVKAFNAMATRLGEIMRSQREMTLAISHELRTPLARMKFALAMTEDQPASAPLRKQLTSIDRDIVEMEALITSFLAYAGFDQQSQQLNQREGHIQDLIEGIITRLLNHQERNINITVNNNTQGTAILCEWSLMQTALQNLIHNALGYANIQIVVSISFTPEQFVIDVDDDGPGVSEYQRQRIFESFVRIHSDSHNRSGFGLGLALVKRIMDWHGGSASCQSSPLGGAKFTLAWPRLKRNHPGR